MQLAVVQAYPAESVRGFNSGDCPAPVVEPEVAEWEALLPQVQCAHGANDPDGGLGIRGSHIQVGRVEVDARVLSALVAGKGEMLPNFVVDLKGKIP